MDRIYNIATELAKKDLNFKEEDKEDQDKLKNLFLKAKENEETVKDRLTAVIAALQQRNPNLLIDESIRDEVLRNMEEKIYSGNIDSIVDLHDNATIQELMDPVENRQAYEAAVSGMLEQSIIDGGKIALTAVIVNQIREGILDQKQLESLDNMLLNSKEIKERRSKDFGSIWNPEASEEEKLEAAKRLGVDDIKATEYFKTTKGPKADRGRIAFIARLVIMDDELCDQRAAILAAQYGMEDLVGKNGKISMDVLFQRMQEAVKGDSGAEKNFATIDDFKRIINKANESKARNALKTFSKYQGFEDEWNKCQTEGERQVLISEFLEAQQTDKDSINKIRQLRDDGDIERLEQHLLSMVDSKRGDMKKILIRSAELIKDPDTAKSVIEKINEAFDTKENNGKNVTKKEEVDEESR